jgi:hypothetical protein
MKLGMFMLVFVLFGLVTKAQIKDENGCIISSHDLSNTTIHSSGLSQTATPPVEYTDIRALDEINIPNVADAYPFISADGLRLYYTRASSLWYAERNTRSEIFSNPAKLRMENVSGEVRSCWLTNDELEIFYTVGTFGNVMHHAKRSIVNSAFTTPTPMVLEGLFASFKSAPSLTPDKSQMYLFYDDRIAILNRTGEYSYSLIGEIMAPAGFRIGPGQLSKDGLRFYTSFESLSTGNEELYCYTRNTLQDSFNIYAPVGIISQERLHQPSEALNGSLLLYVSSIANDWNENDLYEASSAAGQAMATLAVDTITARAGDIVEIPVYLRENQGLSLSGATGFSAELRFHATLLAPVGATPKGTIDNGERTIHINNIPLLPDTDGVLIRLQFIAMLGNAGGTQLHIEKSFAHGGDVVVTEIPGYFLLSDICHEGGTRLFFETGNIALQQNRPNPFNASTVIDYEVIENGQTRLYVMDMMGRTVAVLVDGIVEAGHYSVLFDASALPSGSYLYVLQTPSERLLKLMEVAK